MMSIKGNRGRQQGHRYSRDSEYSSNHSYRTSKKITKDEEDEDVLPARIQVKRRDLVTCDRGVPGSVWMQPPFRWDPVPFGLDSERLDESKIVEPSVQNKSLRTFLSNPSLPLVYGITGSPDDSKAKLFAAYLLEQHVCHLVKKNVSPRIHWEILYGDYGNRMLKEYEGASTIEEPTILVISNLSVNSTPAKLEKAKDLLERFSNLPRLVVASGEDPISLFSTKLYSPCNALAYFPEGLVKRRVQVI